MDGTRLPRPEIAVRVRPATEGPLLARLRAGEDDAYRELLQAHGARLLSVARRLMQDEQDARDCLQDAFLSAFRSIDRFEGKAKLGTWLHRIVVNACLMRLRSRRSKPEELVDPLLPTFDEYGFRIGPSWVMPLGTHELMERAEIRERVRKAIDRLPENYRILIILRDFEEQSTEQTAELLGMTQSAVKVRLHRARLALRRRIGSLSK